MQKNYGVRFTCANLRICPVSARHIKAAFTDLKPPFCIPGGRMRIMFCMATGSLSILQ